MSIARHAAIAATILADHAALPEPCGVDLYDAPFATRKAVNLQARSKRDVLSWAQAFDVDVRATAFKNHIEISAVFTVGGVEIRVWDHAAGADDDLIAGMELPLKQPVSVDMSRFAAVMA